MQELFPTTNLQEYSLAEVNCIDRPAQKIENPESIIYDDVFIYVESPRQISAFKKDKVISINLS